MDDGNGGSNKNYCEACPAGSTSAGGSATTCTCEANKYAKNNKCENCGANTFRTGSVVPGANENKNEVCLEKSCSANQYVKDGACTDCPEGSTSAGGKATTCTPSSSGNVDKGNKGNDGNSSAPAPAQSKKRQAEERAKKLNAGITDPMQKKKADLLAAAAIGGDKVKKLKFAQPVQAASPDDACAQAYDKAGVRSSLGACVATQTSSSGRRLVASQYDVELLFSSAEVDDAALTEAVNSLKANGLESTTSSVDSIEELKNIPGVDVTELATFETEAKAAAEEAEAQSPPEAPLPSPPPAPPPSPPPQLITDDEDHAPGRAGALLVTAFATLACVLFV